jgi:Mn-containing catalase
MYHHVKKLMYTVRVDEPDPRFGNMLLEQFGGANGELAAAMQYSIQGLNCEDPERKDLLMDIGTEELSHLEIVGCLARMHLKPMKNRTGGLPASGSRTRLHAFAHGTSRTSSSAEVARPRLSNSRTAAARLGIRA